MNFRLSAAEVLQGDFSLSPMPVGKQTLTVFFVTAEQKWIELARVPLTIASEQQDSTSKFKPSLVIGAKTEAYEKTESGTTPSDRTRAIDLTTQAGLEASSSGEDWQMESQIAVIGSSYRQEAVAYSTDGMDASKIDLASYLVQGTANNRFGVGSFSLGNVQFGNHPALVNALGNRGLVLGQKLGSRVDASFASQAGGMLLGTNNLFGINDRGHRIDSFMLGTELLERANGLRVEISHTDAAVRAQLSPGSGVVPEAAKSRGWGIRMTSRSTDEALRGELLYSASGYTPAGDPAFGIAAGPTSKASAYVMDMGYDVLRNAVLGSTPVSLNLGFKREHAGSGYLSLAAGFGADYLMDVTSLNANIGVVNAVLQINRREDNVDNLPTFMKNRVQGTVLNINTPLAQLVNSAAPSPWLPTLGYGFNRSHNFADTGFVPLGQTTADLPDVLATTHGLNIGWNIAPFMFGYAYNRTLQDTLQLSDPTRDIRDVRHAINLGWMPRPQFSINSSIETSQSLQLVTAEARYSQNGQLTFNWLVNPQYIFSGGVNLSLGNDSLGTQSQRSQQLQWQMARNFAWTRFDSSKAPGQWYVRFARNVNTSNNTTLPTTSRTGRTLLMLGLNLTFL